MGGSGRGWLGGLAWVEGSDFLDGFFDMDGVGVGAVAERGAHEERQEDDGEYQRDEEHGADFQFFQLGVQFGFCHGWFLSFGLRLGCGFG